LVDQGYKGWLVEFAKRWFGLIVDVVSRSPKQREFSYNHNAGKSNEPLGGWIGAASSARSMNEPQNRVKVIFSSLQFG
jgi:hypothetical protein